MHLYFSADVRRRLFLTIILFVQTWGTQAKWLAADRNVWSNRIRFKNVRRTCSEILKVQIVRTSILSSNSKVTKVLDIGNDCLHLFFWSNYSKTPSWVTYLVVLLWYLIVLVQWDWEIPTACGRLCPEINLSRLFSFPYILFANIFQAMHILRSYIPIFRA